MSGQRGRPPKNAPRGRRATGDGTVKYDRSRDRWRAYAPVDGDGKRTYLGAAESEDEARELIRQHKRRVGLVDKNDPVETVGELASRWLDDFMHTGGREVSTRAVRQQRVTTHIIGDPILGRVPVDALHIETVQAWLRRKADEGYVTAAGKHKTYSSSTLRDLRADLAQIVKWAVARGYMDRNPVDGVKLPDSVQPGTRARAMTSDEMQRLIKECTVSDRHAAVLVLACITTGKRSNEMAGLVWADIDFDAGAIYVHRAMKRGDGGSPTHLGPTKTDVEHAPIGLPAVLADALIEYRDRQERERAAAGKHWSTDWTDDLVFRTSLGTPHNRSNVLRTLRGLLRDAGLDERYTIKDLRTTYLTMMADSGASVLDIMRQAGHRDERMALTRYIKRRPGQVERTGSAMVDQLAQ